jgi:hypothetical protein
MIQNLGKGSVMSKDGFDNENKIIAAIDGKTYETLNPNIQKMLKTIFPAINRTDILSCKKRAGNDKADIEIQLGATSAKVSIKKGTGNSVHQEPIENFITFLRSTFGDDSTSFDAIRHFIWGDGTLDGSGDKSMRIGARNYAIKHKNNLEIIKKYFEQIKKQLVIRFVLLGDRGFNVPDFVYYGDINKGICVPSNKVVDYLVNDANLANSAIPVGGLTFQAWNRAIKEDSVSEEKRGQIQLKWSHIKSDLEFIANE